MGRDGNEFLDVTCKIKGWVSLKILDETFQTSSFEEINSWKSPMLCFVPSKVSRDSNKYQNTSFSHIYCVNELDKAQGTRSHSSIFIMISVFD